MKMAWSDPRHFLRLGALSQAHHPGLQRLRLMTEICSADQGLLHRQPDLAKRTAPAVLIGEIATERRSIRPRKMEIRQRLVQLPTAQARVGRASAFIRIIHILLAKGGRPGVFRAKTTRG